MKFAKIWQKLSVVTTATLISLGMGNGAHAFTFTNPTTGNQYFLTSSVSNWTDAQAEATTAGGNLVTINDAQEQAWLLSTFGNAQLFWIGFNRISDNVWQWASGESVDYTHWALYEPNNTISYGGQYYGDENYTLMNWQRDGAWNDVSNTYIKTRGIVEIVQDVITKLPDILPDEPIEACEL